MPQDAFTIRRSVEELSSLLVGGKINKVVQPDKDSVVLYIYTGRSLLKLKLCTGASFCRVSLTDVEPDVPLVAPNFCMLLRKYVLGAEITGIEQIGYERIVAVRLHCTSDFSSADRTLFVEIMGKYSNVVLVEGDTILGALKTTSLEENSRRILFSGAKYAFPAPQDKADPTSDNALRLALSGFEDEGDKANFLFAKVAGIAYPTAVEIVKKYEEEGGDIIAVFKEYMFGEKYAPCVQYKGGAPFEFFARAVEGAKPVESLSEAQKEVYDYKENKKSFDDKKRKLLSVVSALKKKQEKLISITADKLKECDEKEKYRLFGELITANIYRLERGMGACFLQNYYEEGCPEVKIPLDTTLSPAKNAQKYYKKYNKLKRTVEALEPRYLKELDDLAYTESVLSSVALAEESCDLIEIRQELVSMGLIKEPNLKKKKAVEETPFRTFEKDGFTILAGRNNVQNDRLLRSVSPTDIWLHTQKYHSSHVVILTEGRSVPDEVLLFAAGVCAKYSDGKSGGKIPVDYCERRFVKKPNKAKDGFVIYTDYKTLMVEAIE